VGVGGGGGGMKLEEMSAELKAWRGGGLCCAYCYSTDFADGTATIADGGTENRNVVVVCHHCRQRRYCSGVCRDKDWRAVSNFNFSEADVNEADVNSVVDFKEEEVEAEGSAFRFPLLGQGHQHFCSGSGDGGDGSGNCISDGNEDLIPFPCGEEGSCWKVTPDRGIVALQPIRKDARIMVEKVLLKSRWQQLLANSESSSDEYSHINDNSIRSMSSSFTRNNPSSVVVSTIQHHLPPVTGSIDDKWSRHQIGLPVDWLTHLTTTTAAAAATAAATATPAELTAINDKHQQQQHQQQVNLDSGDAGMCLRASHLRHSCSPNADQWLVS
jgi:hypothetical protein